MSITRENNQQNVVNLIRNVDVSTNGDVIAQNNQNFEQEKQDFIKKKNKEIIEQLAQVTKQMKDSGEMKNLQKHDFFSLIMKLLVFMSLSPYVVLFCFRESVTENSLLAIILASLIELVSAILVLPKVIANYLYDTEEENNMTQLLKVLHEIKEDDQT